MRWNSGWPLLPAAGALPVQCMPPAHHGAGSSRTSVFTSKFVATCFANTLDALGHPRGHLHGVEGALAGRGGDQGAGAHPRQAVAIRVHQVPLRAGRPGQGGRHRAPGGRRQHCARHGRGGRGDRLGHGCSGRGDRHGHGRGGRGRRRHLHRLVGGGGRRCETLVGAALGRGGGEGDCARALVHAGARVAVRGLRWQCAASLHADGRVGQSDLPDGGRSHRRALRRGARGARPAQHRPRTLRQHDGPIRLCRL